MNKPNKTSVSLNPDELQAYMRDTGVTNASKKYYPLIQWQPSEFGDMDVTIKANGEWWHEGTKMTRQSLVTFFSSLLWLEEKNQTKSYYLKTPVQQLQITVEDAPLLITDVNIIKPQSAVTPHSLKEDSDEHDSDDSDDSDDDYVIEFVTQTNDTVCLGDDNLIYFANYEGDIRPYMRVRDNLHALLSRTVFYHLVEIGSVHEQGVNTFLSLKSGGKVFDILFIE